MPFDCQHIDIALDNIWQAFGENVNHDFLLPLWDLAYTLDCFLNDFHKVESLS